MVCSQELTACKKYVNVLKQENVLLTDKVSILTRQVDEEGKTTTAADKNRLLPDGVLVAGGVGIGGAAVAVGAPLVAVGVGLGALIIALIGADK